MNFKKLVASFGLLTTLLSVGSARATIYTHNLIYNDSDHGNSLEARITFDDAHIPGTDQWPNGGPIDFNFITNISFTYTGTGGVQTLSNSDFDSADALVRFEFTGTPDLSVSNLQTQLTDLAFQTDTDATFLMGFNFGARYAQQLSATADDFSLNRTEYHSPGPLPFFGLLTAFSYMKKIKRKYKSIT